MNLSHDHGEECICGLMADSLLAFSSSLKGPSSLVRSSEPVSRVFGSTCCFDCSQQHRCTSHIDEYEPYSKPFLDSALFRCKIAGDSTFFGGLPDQSGGNTTLGWERIFGFLCVNMQRCQSEQPFKPLSFAPTLLTEACTKTSTYPKIYTGEVSIQQTLPCFMLYQEFT